MRPPWRSICNEFMKVATRSSAASIFLLSRRFFKRSGRLNLTALGSKLLEHVKSLFFTSSGDNNRVLLSFCTRPRLEVRVLRKCPKLKMDDLDPDLDSFASSIDRSFLGRELPLHLEKEATLEVEVKVDSGFSLISSG